LSSICSFLILHYGIYSHVNTLLFLQKELVMELFLGLIALVVVGYVIYYYNTKEKKQEETLSSVNRYTGETVEAPYKVESPAPSPEATVAVVTPVTAVAVAEAVDVQITDAVTQAPAKKTRKPRAPKVEAKPVAKKADKKAAPKKVAAIKVKPKATKSKKA
jgi:hypothetical protein